MTVKQLWNDSSPAKVFAWYKYVSNKQRYDLWKEHGLLLALLT